MDPAAAARPDEEEAHRRRSTDCIYFLASPLTCKKGSECDYRHSDAARMNPRDCWYWFNGNCTNPKCSFRHPPLDNLLGAPTTPRAPQQPAPQVSVPVPAQAHGPIPAKQGVPCYYFQKGICAKGDRCAFSHGPQSAGNPAPQPAAAAKVFTPALHSNPQLKNSWTKPNSSPRQNTPEGIQGKSKVTHGHDAKPVQKQHVTTRVDHSSRIYHSNSFAQSGTTKHHQAQPSVEDGLTKNGMEVGEFLREPSAGSGVLVRGVDDDSEQSVKGNHSSHRHRTNGTGMMRQAHGGYEPERSYRSSAETLLSEKTISQRESMPVATAGSSDLRHRLLKQRKLNNNSRSTEAPDTSEAYLKDERNDQHRWRGEEHDGLSRSRLRDRIRVPGETSFDRLGSHSEKEWDRGPRGRLSPPKHTDLRGKLHERLKTRSAEEIPGNSAKSLVVKASSGEDAESLNFAGPKSLAELKAKKGVGNSSGKDATIIKGVASSGITSGIEDATMDPAPFEGPKPLSAILKRKRGVPSEDATGSIRGDEDDAAGVDEEPRILVNDTVGEDMEGNADDEEEEEGEAFHPEDDVAYDDNADEAGGGQELEEHQDVEAAAEEYDYEMVDDVAAAGPELEEHQAEAAEDYDYEAADVNAEEENEYQEYQDDDDLDEDDDDDFARKVGVMIS